MNVPATEDSRWFVVVLAVVLLVLFAAQTCSHRTSTVTTSLSTSELKPGETLTAGFITLDGEEHSFTTNKKGTVRTSDLIVQFGDGSTINIQTGKIKNLGKGYIIYDGTTYPGLE